MPVKAADLDERARVFFEEAQATGVVSDTAKITVLGSRPAPLPFGLAN
ncbi:hypothetical protein [Glutamicibacter uratoxydans]